MCADLAFLKPEHVESGFIEIHSDAPDNEKLFFDIFSSDGWKTPLSLWMYYQRRHRTSNFVEGWHHKININLLNPKPGRGKVSRLGQDGQKDRKSSSKE